MITLILGPMMSGKSSILISQANALKYAKKECVCIYPSKDTRAPDGYISSRTGSKIPAIQIANISDLESVGRNIEAYDAIIIDEIQFLPSLVSLVKKCLQFRVNVYASGLLGDVNGEIFTGVAELLPFANKIIYCEGVCKDCGKPSTMSIRYIDGKVDHTRDVIIEGSKTGVEYKDLCNECWIREMSYE